MITRRSFLQVAAATAAVTGLGGGLRRAAASSAIRQEDLLRFSPKGQLTILHMADTHAQLRPIYYREPSLNLGVGDARGKLPHLTGAALLDAFAIRPASADAYMLSPDDYEALARTYGRVGGLDRIATLVNAIRQERGANRVLLLDGGDALQGSFTALATKGADMVGVMEALGVEATTGHWEFTLGARRVAELYGGINRPGSSSISFLAGNVLDNEFADPVFDAMRLFEKGGVLVAVIGQAFPYTPIANPRWMIPNWSFGIRETALRANVARARARGAQVVVLLSHNGFDVDAKLATRIEGLDIILTGHTHDALPQPLRIGDTYLVASGSHGKFLSRLDLEVEGGRLRDVAYALIPVLADAIAPDPRVASLIDGIRALDEEMLVTELARTDGLLYRRGTFGGTLDDVICDALMSERDAQIALSPGFRWGATLIPGQPVTWDDVYNATAITYPAAYRSVMKGANLKLILEDVADNLFNPDPYYQQGGDMVRVGGMGYTINVDAAMGSRISDLRLASGEPIEAEADYVVAGWGSVNQDVQGPSIWDVVAAHLRARQVLSPQPRKSVKIVRAGG
ncbi:MAG TPA: thiosulfohydrolase SoxB [Hyphomicrobiaceae bacterium]|nr:thiosulfohydrolase SoxB [Hyphomicrobiaceae bacterium]